MTQVIWKNTKLVGCAEVEGYDRSGRIGENKVAMQICHYYPPGNIEDNFVKNVEKESSTDLVDTYNVSDFLNKYHPEQRSRAGQDM